MKKVYLFIIGLVLCLIHTQGLTEAIYVQGGDSNNPKLVPVENYSVPYYREVDTLSAIQEFYYAKAPTKGKYEITYWCTKGGADALGGKGIILGLYDSAGNFLYSVSVTPDKQKASYEVNKKDDCFFWVIDGRNNLFACNIYFSIDFVCDSSFHVPIEPQTTREATCILTGEDITYCGICNEALIINEIPALGHTGGKKEILQAASCMATGIEGNICITCGEVLSTSVLPSTAHIAAPMTAVKAPTCTEPGLSEQHCMVCNITLSTESPAALGHSPGEWRDVQSATCTADGSRSQFCAVCNIVLATEAIPAHGHRAMDWQITREAACLQSGLRETKCSECGLTMESEQLSALGHSYTEWETLTEATKEQEGEKRRHCINCGDTQFEKIEKIPKVFGIF